MRTNTLHNIRQKMTAVEKELNKVSDMLGKLEKELEYPNQTTLADLQTYPEVEHYLSETRRYTTYNEFREYAAKVGPKIICEQIRDWTGYTLTFPQIRRIAKETLTPPQIEVIE